MTSIRNLDPAISQFLSRKSDYSVALFHELVLAFEEIGATDFHAAKTMVCFKRRRNFACVIQFGKGFIDLLLPFKEPFEDNLCFRKISTLAGDGQFNHHVRIMDKEDINEEVRFYMKKAFDLAI